jgi:hypothetical protein
VRLGRPRSLNGEQIAEAVRLRAEGESFADIAAQLGVHRQTLRTALRREPETPVDRSGMSEHSGSSETQPAADVDGGRPPPADESTQWVRRNLIDRTLVLVRSVVLGPRTVEVTEDGMILCPCHLELLSYDEVMASDQTQHIIGMRHRDVRRVVPIGVAEREPRMPTEIERSRW